LHHAPVQIFVIIVRMVVCLIPGVECTRFFRLIEDDGPHLFAAFLSAFHKTATAAKKTVPNMLKYLMQASFMFNLVLFISSLLLSKIRQHLYQFSRIFLLCAPSYNASMATRPGASRPFYPPSALLSCCLVAA